MSDRLRFKSWLRTPLGVIWYVYEPGCPDTTDITALSVGQSVLGSEVGKFGYRVADIFPDRYQLRGSKILSKPENSIPVDEVVRTEDRRAGL